MGKTLKIPVSGTLGVLLSLVKRELLPLNQGDDVLKQMIDKGYYAPIQSLREILK